MFGLVSQFLGFSSITLSAAPAPLTSPPHSAFHPSYLIQTAPQGPTLDDLLTQCILPTGLILLRAALGVIHDPSLDFVIYLPLEFQGHIFIFSLNISTRRLSTLCSLFIYLVYPLPFFTNKQMEAQRSLVP